MKTTRSSVSSHRTCSAISRWPWWIGSNVPPIKPTRAIFRELSTLRVAAGNHRQDVQDLPALRASDQFKVEYITGPEPRCCAGRRGHGRQLVREARQRHRPAQRELIGLDRLD